MDPQDWVRTMGHLGQLASWQSRDTPTTKKGKGKAKGRLVDQKQTAKEMKGRREGGT